jgi:hypothetical protein
VTVTGYTIEQGATGAWWVRVQRQGRRPQAWRFDTWDEAVHFADRLRTAAPAPPSRAGEGETALLRALAAWAGAARRPEGRPGSAGPRARLRSLAGRELPPADA